MSPAAAAPARLTDLPEDILAHIARHIGPTPPDLLPFAQASPVFHGPALSAQDDHLRLTAATAPRQWAALAHPHLRALTLSTPVPSDPPLFAAYALLRAPRLTALSTRADNFTLSLVSTAPRLTRLTLHLRRADVFPQLLHALATLPLLHTLALSFAPDLTLVRLPPAVRCACAPLRADPALLARAAPHVTDFSLSCACAAAVRCTVPPFARLRALALSGPLPRDHPPSHLRALAPHLETLRLTAAAAPVALARALGPAVTHLSASAPTASAGRLASHHILALVADCPRLRALRAAMHPDASRAFPALRPLTSLHVWQPVSRPSSSLPLAGCPVPRAALATLPALRHLHLHGAAVHLNDLPALVLRPTLTPAATHPALLDSEQTPLEPLQSLTVDLVGQPAPLDIWLRTLLAAARNAPRLATLTVCPLADDVAAVAARSMFAPATATAAPRVQIATDARFAQCRRHDLRKAVERLQNRRPQILLAGVVEAVDKLVLASERAAAALAAKHHASTSPATTPPVHPVPSHPPVQHQLPAVAAPVHPAQMAVVPYEQIGVHEDLLDDGEGWAPNDVL